MKIDVPKEDEKEKADEVLVEHVTNPEVKEELRELIKSYQSIANKSTGIKMHIALTDNIPVHQSPKRLSTEQKDIINEIIDG